MTKRMAGDEPMLPRILEALGLIPGARRALEELSNDERVIAQSLRSMSEVPGSDPRDYRVEPGLWASQLLPLGVSIDQAIQDGVWSRGEPHDDHPHGRRETRQRLLEGP